MDAGRVVACLLMLASMDFGLAFPGSSLYNIFSPWKDTKTWLFAMSGRRKPYQFVNDIGELEGFNVDIIKEVCRVAGKKCDVVLSPFTECGFTERDINYPGRGLMSGWFDACVGYANTVDRQGSYDFTDPFLTNGAYFAVSPGNPSGFAISNPDNSQLTVTHLTGAYTNIYCLNRLGKQFKNIVVAANLPEAKALLANGTAQVLFSARSSIPGLDVIPQEQRCTQGGSGMMVKKGSCLPDWWNPAFSYYRRIGRYSNLCSLSGVKYGRKINCI